MRYILYELVTSMKYNLHEVKPQWTRNLYEV